MSNITVESLQKLFDSLESSYSVELPERYKKFLLDEEYKKYSNVKLTGYVQGPYELDFVNSSLLSLEEIGEYAGIYDIDDIPWDEDYADYVPLALLSHPDVDESKCFFVIDVVKKDSPVLLFDYEGWTLYPVSDSFDGFLEKLPEAHNDISRSFTPGDGDEEDDDDDE
jgi:hypothetical protein